MSRLENRPWVLVPNKIVRYPGGREIDRFRGIFPGEDDRRPEAWVGSDTPVRTAGENGHDPHDGMAECILPDGRRVWLPDAIGENPEAILGKEHVKKIGPKLGVLVKLLDAEKQLGLQCHPSRDYAKAHFDSDFGKEESWYVIGLRDDAPETPYVLMGFKEGVTREDFARGYEAEDISAMEACCHKVPVQVGDTFFIAAGLPHAIGCGVFVVEVQEPSDITVGAHKPKEWLQGEELEKFGDVLLGCYNYDGTDYDENLRRYRIPPKTIREGDWGKEQIIIGPDQTDYFSFTRLDVSSSTELLSVPAPQVSVVISGEGTLVCGDETIEVKQGSELFFPYSVDPVTVRAKEGSTLSLILAKPQIYDMA